MGRLCCNEQNLENDQKKESNRLLVSAPTTDASDIQWIIGKLGNADVDYDYIGVNYLSGYTK